MGAVEPIPAHLAVEIEPFSDEELDAAIDAVWAGIPEDVPARVGNFALSDEARAEWAMRKLVDFQIRLHEVERQHDEWVARIEANRAEMTKRLAARVTVFETSLAQYARNRRYLDDKDATIRLPSGTLRTTKARSATIYIGDDAQFAAWATKHLPADEVRKVLTHIPKVYVSELRKLAVRVRETEGGELTVEWSPAEGQWQPVEGCYAEAPTIKPTVQPDLSS